ncbi:hypothetical protein [uncultured Desulfovibrio sp.]|uniref:hypothetical protein n=1 Tax=uncultured Desulfovibrio sp. TaxID=167968 RepID=UPI0026078441|nr:hypothetical protein [uncultured Desulfovibrio sp.]
MSVPVLAEERGVDARGADALLDVLSSMGGYLEKTAPTTAGGLADTPAVYTMPDAGERRWTSAIPFPTCPCCGIWPIPSEALGGTGVHGPGRQTPDPASQHSRRRRGRPFLHHGHEFHSRAHGRSLGGCPATCRSAGFQGASGYTQAFLEILPMAEALIFDRHVGI